ncbi:MAG: flagellar protein FliS [Gammaproteobacteria bacterium]|jgi:flagellar protein FliS
MNNMRALNVKALQQYTQLGIRTEVENASQHRLIQMLMEGALSRIMKAKVYIKNNDVQMKGEFISMAISIIGGLRDSLDHKAGADLALNLDNLYEYMSSRLLEANIKSDISILDEVHDLLSEIKAAWDAIAQPPISSPPMRSANLDIMQKRAI